MLRNSKAIHPILVVQYRVFWYCNTGCFGIAIYGILVDQNRVFSKRLIMRLLEARKVYKIKMCNFYAISG